MSPDKETDSSKLKIEDVLADFFVKKIAEEHQQKSHSKEKKHKKQKKKAKKRHNHSSSSCCGESAEEDYYSRLKHKHAHKRTHRTRSSNTEYKRRKKSKHRHRSNNVETSPKSKKTSIKKEESGSNSSTDRDKESSIQQDLKVEYHGEIFSSPTDVTEKSEVNLRTESTEVSGSSITCQTTHDCSDKHVLKGEMNQLSLKFESCDGAFNVSDKEIVRPSKSSPECTSLHVQPMPHSKDDHLAVDSSGNVKCTEGKYVEKVLGKVSQPQISTDSTELTSSLLTNSELTEEKSNIRTEIQEALSETLNSHNNEIVKTSLNCRVSCKQSMLKDSSGSLNDKLEEQVSKKHESEYFRKSDTDSSKLKQKLSNLKRQELLENSMKHKKKMSSKSTKRHKKKHEERDEKYRKEALRYQSSEKSRSRYEHRYFKDDYFPRKHRTFHRKSKDRYVKHSPCKSPSSDRTQRINKTKLLEVATRNALTMMEKGALPKGISGEMLKENMVKIKAGGKSVKELTDFCRNLSSKEGTVDVEEDSKNSAEESDQPFIHHPFKLKEASVIKLNIKNSVQLPVKSHAEKITENARTLSLQFPVSSGNQHRQKELEWVPVKKNEPKACELTTSVPERSPACKTKVLFPPKTESCAYLQIPMPLATGPPPPPVKSSPLPLQPQPPPSLFQVMSVPSTANISAAAPVSVSPVQTTLYPQTYKAANLPRPSYSKPISVDATNKINEVRKQLQTWVQSQQVPGQFTGSTNVKLLSAEELCGPRPVWVKKDVFSKAAPVTEGKGMSLLRKMGWNPGEGLGKNKEGSLEPLFLNIKTDKRGLVSVGESGKRFKAQQPTVQNSCNKHPVSILMETCSKRRWEQPTYTLVSESGPSHKKSFLYKVSVNNKEYQPSMSRLGKKQAKAEAAALCLQALGILPIEYKIT